MRERRSRFHGFGLSRKLMQAKCVTYTISFLFDLISSLVDKEISFRHMNVTFTIILVAVGCVTGLSETEGSPAVCSDLSLSVSWILRGRRRRGERGEGCSHHCIDQASRVLSPI